MHHALADGGAANALLANVTDDVARRHGGRPGRRPGHARADARRGARRCGSRSRDAIRQTAHAARRCCGRTGARRRRGAAAPRRVAGRPCPGRCSTCRAPRFNGPLTARRTFATATPAAGRHQGGPAGARGDASTTWCSRVVAGAAADAGWTPAASTPSRPWWPACPVAPTPRAPAPRLGGNRVSNLFTSLATDVDDPHRAAAPDLPAPPRSPRRIQQTLGPDMLIDWVQFTPPAPLSARHAPLLADRARRPPPAAVQRDRVQRPRPRRARHHRRRPARRPVQRRPDPRGDRAQRHRLVLRGPA